MWVCGDFCRRYVDRHDLAQALKNVALTGPRPEGLSNLSPGNACTASDTVLPPAFFVQPRAQPIYITGAFIVARHHGGMHGRRN